ncbi:MAG: PIG-L deacetylase family protein [Paracoccaceae bacterium]
MACLTDGAASHGDSQSVLPAQLADIRKLELETAVNRLGGATSDITWIGAPDAGLAVSHEIVATVTALARTCNAGLLLAPSPLDPHGDHVAGALIGRDVVSAHGNLRLAYYPIWSRWHGGGHAPVPAGTLTVCLPVGPFATRKASAIAAHASQLGMIVPDAPGGFEMPPGFAAFFAEQDEIYFLQQPGMRT